jgi:hypothetical protein
MSSPRNPTRFAAGLAIWVALLGGVASFALARSAELRPPAERVLRYAMRGPARIERRIEAIDNGYGWSHVDSGDPVLAGEARTFIGTVESVREDTAAVGTKAYVARILLDPEYDPADLEGARVEYGESSGDTAWIIATLLPPKKRVLVFDQLRSFSSGHSAEIKELLDPIMEQVVEHAEQVLETTLTPTIKRHEHEIDVLLDRYRSTLKDELLPVLKESLGPAAKEKAKPILTKIGRECWDALPMWEGSWAYFKTKLPFQKTNYIDEWWQEFLEKKAMPILKEHEDELVKAGEDLVKDGFKDPKVRAAFNDVMKKLAKDKEFRDLARAIVEEALIKPFNPGALWDKIAADPRNRSRFAKLNQAFAPVMQRIVRLVAVEQRLDGRDGLSPEVAQVLRRKVFNKDSRWVMVTPKRPLVPRTARS